MLYIGRKYWSNLGGKLNCQNTYRRCTSMGVWFWNLTRRCFFNCHYIGNRKNINLVWKMVEN